MPFICQKSGAAIRSLCLVLIFFGWFLGGGPLRAQDASPQMLKEASRRTGLSEEEIKEYLARKNGVAGKAEAAEMDEPGRDELEGIDDTAGTAGRFLDFDQTILLPFDESRARDLADTLDLVETMLAGAAEGPDYFGADFFSLEAGLFSPPSFGPVPASYRLGVGDEVIVNAWGAIEFQETRVVDRDGCIILPKGGKVVCAGQTLDQVQDAVRRTLARFHSTIDTGEGGDTTVEVLLGRLRSIRVFVVGAVERPGSYELSSVSRVLTALYAAGGPTADGSMRRIRLVREAETVAEMDLYTYLLQGKRIDDVSLREGDTVFVPDVGPRVRISGEVKRPTLYEMIEGESLSDLLAYCGGFSAYAVSDFVLLKRVLPPDQRRPGTPDYTYRDVLVDPVSMKPVGSPLPLVDGDEVLVDRIQDLESGYVDVSGKVKKPGRYMWLEGMTLQDLLARAGGLMPDALREMALIDRLSPRGDFLQVGVSLEETALETGDEVVLQVRDHLHVYARWENQDRPQVTIAGQVYEPKAVYYRDGMTLGDLVLKASGLKRNADRLRVEVARLDFGARSSRDLGSRPEKSVDVKILEMGPEFLSREESFLLEPWDRVYIRGLPWWEEQNTVEIHGEVFYPGTFSLVRKDERISSLIKRAGGLKPDAYLVGARVVRATREVGNIAIDLAEALAHPGSDQDIILYEGDRLYIPNRMFTVKVVGEVGFPTSLVFEDGLDIDDYVNRAGGYLEMADKDRSRVVWPNGMSLPNKGSSEVKAGSTIIVPVKPPPEGRGTWETIRDITSIVASLATVYIVVTK